MIRAVGSGDDGKCKPQYGARTGGQRQGDRKRRPCRNSGTGDFGGSQEDFWSSPGDGGQIQSRDRGRGPVFDRGGSLPWRARRCGAPNPPGRGPKTRTGGRGGRRAPLPGVLPAGRQEQGRGTGPEIRGPFGADDPTSWVRADCITDGQAGDHSARPRSGA